MRAGETLREVKVKIEPNGKSHNLSGPAPGDRRRIFVRPVSESSIDIECKNASGKPHVELVVGYVRERLLLEMRSANSSLW